ncbi:MAG TPA: DUF748 domain-containing protein [Negativicutes bacterium]|nr:DUF748 domain-containing protein [Negativicutes bacterium]
MDKQRWLRIAKITAGVMCIAFILLVIVVRINAPKIAPVVGNMVLERAATSLNGKLEAGEIDFSLFGATILRNVRLADAKGAAVLSCEELSVDFSFADLLRGNFSMDRVKSIELSGARFNLEQDKAGRWNTESLVKPSDQPFDFRGKVVFRKSAVAVTTPQVKREIDSLEGDLAFAGYPAVAVDLAGKLQKTGIKAAGSWTKDGPYNIALKADTIEIADWQPFVPASAKITLTGGQVKDLAVTVKSGKDVPSVQGEGKIAGLAAEVDGTKLTDGQGTVRFSEQSLDVAGFTVALSGQKVGIDGQISLSGTTPQVNFSVVAQNYDPAGIKGAGALKGPVNFKAAISGPISNIVTRGEFQIANGTFDKTSFTNAAGTFSYAQDVLTFEKVQLSAMGGTLAFSGTWNIKTAVFKQTVTGQNIDSGQVTEKGMQGPVDFTATLTGPDVDHMTIDGRFSMKAGSMSTISFTSLEGQFTKKGNTVDLRGVSIVTSGQRLNASGQVAIAAGKPQLNLSVSSTGLDIKAVQANAPLKGPVAFQANVTGPADNFVAQGNFQMASGSLGRINFTGAKGAFHYAGDLLTINSASGNALGGTLTTAGTITKTTVYNQKVTGQNVDAGFFTDGDVQGKASFTAQISGKDDWDNASADGNFAIKSGNVKGLPFNNMTGNFTKRGTKSDFSNLNMQMAGGLVKGAAFTEGDYIHLKLTPGDSKLALILGPKLAQLIPQEEMQIKFRGVK